MQREIINETEIIGKPSRAEKRKLKKCIVGTENEFNSNAVSVNDIGHPEIIKSISIRC